MSGSAGGVRAVRDRRAPPRHAWPQGRRHEGSSQGCQAAAHGSTPAPAGRTQQAAPAGPRPPSRLAVTAGTLRGATLPLGSQPILLGRSPGCSLVLDDDYSSSRHAKIYTQSGRWYVEDLGSTNGTYVNESRISGTVEIAPGTPVRIGQTVVELQG
ncbi:FHA domain-containing protein FhaB/FipA [Paraoerskovia sediminicola]|uniref:FHA domain-containing protein FhaB/FipA n=1 Tax=Paraoerskovia sediminicola TaxID=1138587 RepID=UPI003D9B035F